MSEQKRLLIIDDEAQLRTTLAFILQDEGYQVETASNSDEALKFFKNTHFDLVFLDLNMPGTGGIYLLEKIRQEFPELPVLILTAYAALDSAIQAVRLGAQDYLIKPIDPPLILTRVAEILEKERAPYRKKEIVTELQHLLDELKQIENNDVTPANANTPAGATDTSRFLYKGPFTLDLHTKYVVISGKYVQITGIYFDYFKTLLTYSPKPVSYHQLVKEAQGFDASKTEARELARWRIHELRKIVELDPQNPKIILTVRGTGYRIEI